MKETNTVSGNDVWPAELTVPIDDAVSLAESLVRKFMELNYIHRDAARAWAGIAMWCSCRLSYGDYVRAEASEHAAVDYAERRMLAWQALRDWLDGTAEQWAEVREFAQDVLDLANEVDYKTVASRAIRAGALGVPGLVWNISRDLEDSRP
jgi:hypothetical protein